MGNHADPDSLVDGETVTTLSLSLNQEMHRNAAARARYLAIYGEEWVPLGTANGDAYFPMPNEETETTTRNTVR